MHACIYTCMGILQADSFLFVRFPEKKRASCCYNILKLKNCWYSGKWIVNKTVFLLKCERVQRRSTAYWCSYCVCVYIFYACRCKKVHARVDFELLNNFRILWRCLMKCCQLLFHVHERNFIDLTWKCLWRKNRYRLWFNIYTWAPNKYALNKFQSFTNYSIELNTFVHHIDWA